MIRLTTRTGISRPGPVPSWRGTGMGRDLCGTGMGWDGLGVGWDGMGRAWHGMGWDGTGPSWDGMGPGSRPAPTNMLSKSITNVVN